MTTKSFRGLMVATAAVMIFAASGAFAQPKPAPGPKLTAAVAKSLNEAQKATQTEDWNTAKTAIATAAAVPSLTDYDHYMIAQFTMVVDARTNDLAGATVAVQQSADSPAQPEADKPKNYKLAAQLSLQAKQYDKALGYAKLLAALNPTDAGSLETISQAYYFSKDYPNALAVLQKIMSAADAAHTKPERNTLNVLMAVQSGMKDEEGAEKTLERLVAEYNDPNDWGQMIDIAYGAKGQRDVDAVWLGRLQMVSGAPPSVQDASILGQAASKLTFFGDAIKAQEDGGTGFPDPKANADKDKKTIAAQIAAAQKANGQYSAKMAEVLYGYGMYPEAEAAARLAISKGGALDSSEAPMVLGQSLAAQGKYDDAIAAFGQVNGGGPATPRVVRLWVDYVNAKKNPPAATAAK